MTGDMAFGIMNVVVLLCMVIGFGQACTNDEGKEDVKLAELQGTYIIEQMSEDPAYTYCDKTAIFYNEIDDNIKIYGALYDSGKDKTIVYIVHMEKIDGSKNYFKTNLTMDEDASTPWNESGSRVLMDYDGDYLVWKMCAAGTDTDSETILILRRKFALEDKKKENYLMNKYREKNTPKFHGAMLPGGKKCPDYFYDYPWWYY